MGSGGWGGGGGWGGVGGGEDSFSLVFENSIVLIKCTLYDTVFQRQVSICRGVVFSYSFSIYCAAYHGIWCSASVMLCHIHSIMCIHLYSVAFCIHVPVYVYIVFSCVGKF